MKKFILITICLCLSIFSARTAFDGAGLVISVNLLNKIKDHTYEELFPNQKFSFSFQSYDLNGLAQLKNTQVEISIRKEDIFVQGNKNQLQVQIQRANVCLSGNLQVFSFTQSIKISPSCSFDLLFQFFKNEYGQILIQKVKIEEFYLSEEGINLPHYLKSSQQYLTQFLQVEIKNYLQKYYIKNIVENINQNLVELKPTIEIPQTLTILQVDFQIPKINEQDLALEANFLFKSEVKQTKQENNFPNPQNNIHLLENLQSDFSLQISQISIQNLLQSLFENNDLNKDIQLPLSYQSQNLLNLNLLFLGVINQFIGNQQIIIRITQKSSPIINFIHNSHIEFVSRNILEFLVNFGDNNISLFKLSTTIKLNLSLDINDENKVKFKLISFKMEDLSFFQNDQEKPSLKLLQKFEYELENILKNKISLQQITISNKLFNLRDALILIQERYILIIGDINLVKLSQI